MHREPNIHLRFATGRVYVRNVMCAFHKTFHSVKFSIVLLDSDSEPGPRRRPVRTSS